VRAGLPRRQFVSRLAHRDQYHWLSSRRNRLGQWRVIDAAVESSDNQSDRFVVKYSSAATTGNAEVASPSST